jgi:hypothetical protein
MQEMFGIDDIDVSPAPEPSIITKSDESNSEVSSPTEKQHASFLVI